MLDDSWIINSNNYHDVMNAGSYVAYLDKKNRKAEFKQSSPINDKFNKEYRFLDKIQTHHQKLSFEKMGLREYQIEDLRKNALNTISAIMERYGIQKKELK